MIVEEDGRILCREGPMPLALRGFALVLALGCGGVIPYVFLSNLRWDTPVTHRLIVLGCALFALMVGAFLLLVALVRPVTLALDPVAGQVIRSRSGDPRKVLARFALSDLPQPQVLMRDSEEGVYPVLRLSLPRGRPFDATGFRDPDEAEVWRARIARLIASAQ